MKEGLKQGCSLSPVLFALYLAELGNRLVASGLGVKVGNITIPGFCGQYGRHGTRGRGFEGDVENGRGVWKGMEDAV